MSTATFEQTVERFRALGFGKLLSRRAAGLVFRYPDLEVVLEAWPKMTAQQKDEVKALCRSSPIAQAN